MESSRGKQEWGFRPCLCGWNNRCCLLEQSVSMSGSIPLGMVLPQWKTELKVKCRAQPFSLQPHLTCGFCLQYSFKKYWRNDPSVEEWVPKSLKSSVWVSENAVKKIFPRIHSGSDRSPDSIENSFSFIFPHIILGFLTFPTNRGKAHHCRCNWILILN